MYTVDERDEVVELNGLPLSLGGAPLPAVLAAGGRVLLAYLAERVDPDWDGSNPRSVTPDLHDEVVALLEFDSPRAHVFGSPNDETLSGYPLAKRGLGPYGTFEVRHSSWIRALERMNAVHPRHDPRRFDGLRHFIFTFHDSTFECVARGVKFEVRGGSLASTVHELARRLVGAPG